MKYSLLAVAALLSTTLFAQTPKPVANWNFTGNTKDNSGNGWDATNYGCTPAAGKSGQPNTAYKFNGNGNYMMVPHKQAMNMKKWTIAALVKPQGFYNGLCQANIIVERGLSYSASQHCLFYFDNAYDNSCNTFTPTKMVFAASAGGTNPVDWKTGVYVDTTGTWYCVAATFANDTMKLYVNGNFTVSQYYSDQYGPGIVDSMRIGMGTLSATYPNWFNGIMDHLSIYDTALTLAQINTLCTSATNDTATSVGEIDGYTIAAYPNPSADEVTIETSGLGSAKKQLSIINTTGQVVRTAEYTSLTKSVNIQDLTPGVYILKITTGEKYYYGRLLKE